MISANFLINQLAKHGFNFFSGVPCSYLTSVINGVINSKKIKYIGATSDGAAVGIASGAWLAGKKGVVMIQNSGLGNTINPLTSLNYPFKIPILLTLSLTLLSSFSSMQPEAKAIILFLSNTASIIALEP